MSPEELQIMGVSPEMASLPLEDLIRHAERRAVRVDLNGADMGEHTQPATSRVPDYVLKRSEVAIVQTPEINNSVNMVIPDSRDRRGGMGY